MAAGSKRLSLQPARVLLTTLFIVAVGLKPARGYDYDLKLLQTEIGKTVEDIGVGFSFAHEQSNVFKWMEYSGCNAGRTFVNPFMSGSYEDENQKRDIRTADWRSYLSHRWSESRSSQFGDQFGRSFNGDAVESKEAWLSAVENVRNAAKGPGRFWDWLRGQEAINWADLLDHLDRQVDEPQKGQVGNHNYYHRRLKDEGYKVMALWDIRCKNLEYKSVVNINPEYWKERWETYRLFYIGGRWLAERGIEYVELYNEPDKDKKDRGCIDGLRWADDVRIRSQAIRAAYEDETDGKFEPVVVAPALTIAWRTEFSVPLADNWRIPFPETEESLTYTVADVYSLHDYGSFSGPCDTFGPQCRNENGYATRKSYNKAKQKLNQKLLGHVEVSITETNCFTAGQSDKRGHPFFEGKHVADYASTATCLASQFSGLSRIAGGPKFVNVHKLVQTLHATLPSRIAKNGVLYADTTGPPFHVTSSTKTGESLRQFCTKARGGQAVYGVSSADGKDPNYRTSRFNTWSTKSGNNLHVFVINDEWEDDNVVLDFSDFQPDIYSSYIVTSISDYAPHGSHYHGEVSQTGELGESRRVSISVPRESTHIVTLPLVSTRRVEITADRDATFQAEGKANGNDTSIKVKTNGQDSTIGMFNFNKEGKVGDIGVVNAVLQLHLERATNSEPQVLAVFGWNQPWDENNPEWNGISMLNKVEGDIRRTKDNFVNWDDGHISVVGHITIPPGDQIPGEGMKIRLDVSDTIERVSNYAVVRMFRMDDSIGEAPFTLPKDAPQGEYFFASKESSNGDNAPKLLIDYQV